MEARVVVVAALILCVAGCSHAGRTTSALPASPPRVVTPSGAAIAVVGGDQSELLAEAKAAQAEGLSPRYVTVTTSSGNSYAFAPFARVTRSQDALIVHGYSRVYVFDLADARVHYTGYKDDVPGSLLPQVTSAAADDAVAAFRTGGLGVAGCNDCALLLARHAGVVQFTQGWNNVRDPWQVNPEYSLVYGHKTSGNARVAETQYWGICDSWNPNTLIEAGSSGYCVYSSGGPFYSGSYGAKVPRPQHGSVCPQYAWVNSYRQWVSYSVQGNTAHLVFQSGPVNLATISFYPITVDTSFDFNFQGQTNITQSFDVDFFPWDATTFNLTASSPPQTYFSNGGSACDYPGGVTL